MTVKLLYAASLLCFAFCSWICMDDLAPVPASPTEIEGTWVGYEVGSYSDSWTLVCVGNRADVTGPGESYAGSFALQ
jgi:hypothetical protein